MIRQIATVALATTILVSCTTASNMPLDPPVSVSPAVTATPGEGFTMAIGDIAMIEGTAISVVFRDVAGDSRCPVDVTCVWEGNADIVLGLATGRAAWEWLTLGTANGRREAVWREVTVRVIDLSPTPSSERPISRENYRLQLEVELSR